MIHPLFFNPGPFAASFFHPLFFVARPRERGILLRDYNKFRPLSPSPPSTGALVFRLFIFFWRIERLLAWTETKPEHEKPGLARPGNA